MLLCFPFYGRLYPFGSCGNPNSNPLQLRYSDKVLQMPLGYYPKYVRKKFSTTKRSLE
ncbi:hypothetical protein HMPREF1322_1847 [Porphyromonas gingivalis W50]|nr:hypothetical protein HMPREF1322_1847 [Porphyromonas gingivalis W50]